VSFEWRASCGVVHKEVNINKKTVAFWCFALLCLQPCQSHLWEKGAGPRLAAWLFGVLPCFASSLVSPTCERRGLGPGWPLTDR